MSTKYIFYLFYLTLLFNLTAFYNMLSERLGIPLQLQGAFFILTGMLVLAAASVRTQQLFKNVWVVGLFLMVVCFPSFTFFYSPLAQLREVALPLMFFVLVLATLVSVQVRGWPEVWRVLEIAILLNIVGIFISFVFPQQFLTVFSVGKGDYTLGAGRAAGFFLNGNQSAKALTMMTIGWLAVPRVYRRFWRISPILLASFIAILMTGSRSGLLVYAFIAGSASIYQYFAKSGRKFSPWKLYFIYLPLLLPVMLGLFIVALNLAKPYLSDEYARSDMSLTGRLDTYAQGPAAIYDNIIEAAEGRWYVSKPYWDAAFDRPLIGHGVRAQQYMRYMSGLELISHNTYVTFAYEYGFPYMVIFPLFIISFLWLPHRKDAEAHFAQPLMVYFVSAVLLFYLTDGAGHELRPTWIVLGVLLSLMLRPPAVLGKMPNQNTKRAFR